MSNTAPTSTLTLSPSSSKILSLPFHQFRPVLLTVLSNLYNSPHRSIIVVCFSNLFNVHSPTSSHTFSIIMDFQDPPNCMGKIDPDILDWINTVENYFAWNPTIHNQVHYVQGNLGGDALIWWCVNLCGFLLHQVPLNWILTAELLVIRGIAKIRGIIRHCSASHVISFWSGDLVLGPM